MLSWHYAVGEGAPEAPEPWDAAAKQQDGNAGSQSVGMEGLGSFGKDSGSVAKNSPASVDGTNGASPSPVASSTSMSCVGQTRCWRQKQYPEFASLSLSAGLSCL